MASVINQITFLERATETVKDYLNDHPVLYKIALLVNHIFRAAAMGFFMLALPFSAPANVTLCFAASLFYRLTVEGNCTYKFALPAFAGALAFPIAQPAFAAIISKAAFSSLNAFAATFGTLLPFTCYVAYIVLTVNDDVDRNVVPNLLCCLK